MTATATATATLAPTPTPTPTPAADHEISIATAADVLGGIQAATVTRYLRAGKLARLGQGVSADSVTAYITRRDANIARSRYKKAPTTTLSPVEQAAAAWVEAGRLEALARELKAGARQVLDEAGAGRHGRYELRFTAGRTMTDTEAVKAHYAAIDQPVPTKKAAASIKVTRIG